MKIIMCFDQDRGLRMIIILCESNQTLGHNLSFFSVAFLKEQKK